MTTEWFPNAERLRRPPRPHVLLVLGLLCWSALALLIALQPVSSGGRFFAVVGASWIAQAFAGVALLLTTRAEDGAERLP